jgi:uncharacterized membrane protein YfcA
MDMLAGSVLGAPVGVWVLSLVPIAALNRLIGGTLVLVVLLEWAGLHPQRLGGARMARRRRGARWRDRRRGGTPGRPSSLYSATPGLEPANHQGESQAFFVVNQAVILAGYWWIGVLDGHVWRLAASFALPAAGGTALGMLLFSHVDHGRFRRMVFAVLLVAGILLIVRG